MFNTRITDATLEASVRRVIVGGMGWQELANTARDIARRRIKSAGISQALTDFMGACQAIDAAKRRISGSGSSTFESNRLMQLVAFAAIASMPSVTESDEITTQALASRLRDGKGIDPWLYAKVVSFLAGIQASVRAADTARRARGTAALARLISPSSLRGPADELFSGIRELRRYGIKSSYFRHLAGCDAWVYYNLGDFDQLDSVERRPFSENALAFSTLAHDPNTSLPPAFDTFSFEKRQARLTGVSCPSIHAAWTITHDGESDFSLGYGLLTARSAFEKEGAGTQYEAERLMHAMRLYDLTVAQLTVHRTIRQQSLPRQLLSKVLPTSLVPFFAVPRIRTLLDLPLLTGEIEQEVELGLAETKRRSPREHPVEWFIRPLPKGATASRAARERAAKENIELKPGETFVRKHTRGAGNPMPAVREARRHPHRHRKH